MKINEKCQKSNIIKIIQYVLVLGPRRIVLPLGSHLTIHLSFLAPLKFTPVVYVSNGALIRFISFGPFGCRLSVSRYLSRVAPHRWHTQGSQVYPLPSCWLPSAQELHPAAVIHCYSLCFLAVAEADLWHLLGRSSRSRASLCTGNHFTGIHADGLDLSSSCKLSKWYCNNEHN